MLDRIERGAIRKRWRSRLPVAIIFPDSYALGCSNLGFQTLYRLLNSDDSIVAERFFLPEAGSVYGRLRSVESDRPLSDFPILIFSISFELSYLNLPLILKAGGIGLDFQERLSEGGPLVLAGGVACQINPEPIAPLMDAFLLGDFEAVHEEFSSFILSYGSKGLEEALGPHGAGRSGLLEDLADRVQGVYVPSFVENRGVPRSRRISVPKLHVPPDPAPFSPVISSAAAFSDTLLMEVSRGCGRGCRFCAAGFVYRPPRPWPGKSLVSALEHLPEGVSKVGLVGLEFLGREELDNLVEDLLTRGLSIGFSSLRADALTPHFMELMRASGTSSATIAPEAGSERLRSVINKHLTEEQIIHAAVKLVEGGLHNLKLYFMMGLPFEEDEDAHEIARLTEKIAGAVRPIGRKRGRLSRITVSVSTFVPKAWTPFMLAPFCPMEVLERRRKRLKRLFGPMPNVRLQLDSPAAAQLQAVLSRGDRRLSSTLVMSRLKGLSPRRALKELGRDAERYLRNPLDEGADDRGFPWEILDHGIRREFFTAEWRKAGNGVQSRPCNTSVCRKCGVCS